MPIERRRSRLVDNISGIYLFSEMSKLVLGTSQPTVQWTTGTLSFGVKRPGREVDHSPSTSVDVKNEGNYNPSPYTRLHGIYIGTTIILSSSCTGLG